jgi:hypothetical protein
MHDVMGTFTSRTLAGELLTVPGDLDGPTLLCFAYRMWQQRDVDSWLTAVADDERLRVLEVPVLGRRWVPARRFIDGGMAANMDAPTRAGTMCLYTGVERFRRDVLGVRSTKVCATLVGADGRVAWHAFGPAAPDAVAALHAAIDDLSRDSA